MLGYLGVALAALAARRGEETVASRADERQSLASLVAPVVPVLVALVAAAVEIKLGHHLDRAGWLMAFALVVILLVRQAIAVLEILGPRGGGNGGVVERLGQAALGGAGHDDAPVPLHTATPYESL